MTRDPFATLLTQSVAKIIISLGVAPNATLQTASLAGDTSLALNTATDINGVQQSAANVLLPSTVLAFWDGTLGAWEESTAIADVIPVIPNPAAAMNLPLDFGGKGYTSLRLPHASGSTVSTNIFRHPLADNTPALGNGFPLVGVYVLDNATRPTRNKRYQEFGACHVQYRLWGDQPSGVRLKPQIWLERQMDRGERDADRIIEYLETHYRIDVDGTEFVEEIESFAESRRKNITNPSQPYFEWFLDIHFKGRGSTIR